MYHLIQLNFKFTKRKVHVKTLNEFKLSIIKTHLSLQLIILTFYVRNIEV